MRGGAAVRGPSRPSLSRAPSPSAPLSAASLAECAPLACPLAECAIFRVFLAVRAYGS